MTGRDLQNLWEWKRSQNLRQDSGMQSTIDWPNGEPGLRLGPVIDFLWQRVIIFRGLIIGVGRKAGLFVLQGSFNESPPPHKNHNREIIKLNSNHFSILSVET